MVTESLDVTAYSVIVDGLFMYSCDDLPKCFNRPAMLLLYLKYSVPKEYVCYVHLFSAFYFGTERF